VFVCIHYLISLETYRSVISEIKQQLKNLLELPQTETYETVQIQPQDKLSELLQHTMTRFDVSIEEVQELVRQIDFRIDQANSGGYYTLHTCSGREMERGSSSFFAPVNLN
jgi:hypothetical protein